MAPAADGRALAGWRSWLGRFVPAGLGAATSSGEAITLRQPVLRLIPGDPELASKLYAARFGRAPSDSFVRLSWLKHFAASGKTLHALYAMEALRLWHQQHLHKLDPAHACNALLSLTWDGVQLARRADDPTALLQAVTRLSRMVLQVHPQSDGERLLRGAALLSAAVSVTTLDGLRRVAVDDLARGLDGLILPDGAHVSRKGDELLRVTLLLLPVALALRQARDAVPQCLLTALERMVPMLRMLAMEDGGLSLVASAKIHGEAMAAVFAADATRGQALEHAPHAGFTRISFASALLLADDRTLDFEFSAAGERIAKACIMASRKAAQSRSEIVRSREGAVLRYEEGLSHRRSLFLAAKGNDLRAEDYLAVDECVAIDVADGVVIAADASSGSFRLETPTRQIWTGLPRGAAVVIEGRRILLLPNAPARDGRINWALKRISA